MTKKTHIPAGLVMSTAVMMQNHGLTWEECLIGGLTAATAATLPDADIYDGRPMNAVEDVTKIISVCFLMQQLNGIEIDMNGLLLFVILLVLVIPLPHRGLSHSILCGSVFTAAFYYMCKCEIYASWFATAYISHLLLDLLNKKGEPLFYPYQKKYCFRMVDAAGTANDILCCLFCMAYAALLAYLFYEGW